jgi:hypothetical protein
MRTYHKILGLLVALTILVVGTAVTLAQNSSPLAVAAAVETTPVDVSLGQAFGEAMQTARADFIETAVSNGRLTAEQAERLQNWTPMHRGQMGANCGCGLDAPLMDRTMMHTAMAEALALSLEELEAAMAEGTRLPHLLAELNIDPQTVREAMNAARETAVAEALADGAITQEQADCILSQTVRGPHMRGLNNHNHGYDHGHGHGRQQNHDRMGPRNGNQ